VNSTSPSTWRTYAPLLAVGLVALALGLFARFKSLGAASLSVDEYYIVQSVRNVLRTGWPEFDCGGWYQRGLLLQYLSAGLQFFGVSETLAPRAIAAVSSVLALPAVYAIGRRAYSPAVGLIAVTLLLFSVWEVEVARFGRMYTPFQAITAWYAFYFLRYTVDRRASALAPMVLLSVLGILMWEGGVLLAAANFIPMFLIKERIRLSPAFAAKVIGFGLLVALGFLLATTDLRVTSPDMLPASYTGETFDDGMGGVGLLDLAPNYLPTIFAHPLWLVLGVIPLAVVALALREVFVFRSRPLAVLGLVLALVAAICGQFLAVAFILVLLVVFRFLDWREILGPSMRRFQLTLLGCAAFWAAFVAWVFEWQEIDAGSFVRGATLFGYQFARIPYLANVAAWPWARAVPTLAFVMMIGLVAAVVHVTRARAAEALSAERALLALVLCLLVAACMSHPPRLETRYTFFLYPLVIALAVGVLWSFVAARLQRRGLANAVAGALAFGIFVPTEDFDVHHLLHIDDPHIYADISPNLAAHYVPHGDALALVRWLEAHVVPGRDVVIAGTPVVDFYYPNVAYFFYDPRDPMFRQSSCRRGTLERWSNKPLLDTAEAVKAAVPAQGRAFLVVFDDNGRLVNELADMNAQIVADMGGVNVIQVEHL
jgi:hypothetical protein